MNDRDLPKELKNLFTGNYRDRYYSGWWEIYDLRTNVCDQQERVPHIHNNELTIILHADHWNDNSYYHTFYIEGNNVRLSVHAWRGDGRDYWVDHPIKAKRKINQLLKWLKEELAND